MWWAARMHLVPGTYVCVCALPARLPCFCCPQNFPTVFGIQTSNKKYTLQMLKAMALQGITKLAVAFRTDNLFTSTTCEAGLALVPGLQKLNPAFKLVDVIRYNGSAVRTMHACKPR